MKIFMATMGLGIGGAETHIVELAKELKARGHEVVIASNGGVYVAEVEAAGIRHYAVPMHLGVNSNRNFNTQYANFVGTIVDLQIPGGDQ